MTKMGQIKQAGGIPASALAPDEAKVKASATKLSAARGNAARGEDVTLPIFGSVYAEIIGHTKSNKVEADTLEAMTKARIPLTGGFAWSVDLERKARTLAFAIRDPDDHSKPFGDVDEWLDLDDDIIMACSLVYDDVRNRLDPLGAPTLTKERAAEIMDAFQKKSRTLLLSFGIAELSAWLLSGDVQLLISPTPSSSSTEPSPASST